MPIAIPTGTLDYDKVTVATDSSCTHPAGHCFGSDGGSGIPDNLKVAEGRGGSFELWKLSTNKNSVTDKYATTRCQYCLQYYVSEKIA